MEGAELVNSYFAVMVAVAAVLAGASALRFYLVTTLGERIVLVVVVGFATFLATRALIKVLRIVHALVWHERAGKMARPTRAAGALIGIGVSSYVEITAGGGASEYGAVAVHEDGSVTMLAGTSAHGQGHQTTFAMGEAIAHLNALWHAGQVRRQLDADGIYRFQSSAVPKAD